MISEKNKDASIEKILSQGLVPPPSAGKQIKKMLQTLDMRFIFWDLGYSLFFTGITLALVLILLLFVPSEFRYSATVFSAPLLFLLILLFSETSERVSGLYEIKQVCFFHIHQITALRVIFYSIIGAVFSVFISATGVKNGHEFFLLLPICLFALFLCAYGGLVVMRRFPANRLLSAIGTLDSLVLCPLSCSRKWEKSTQYSLGFIPCSRCFRSSHSFR